MAWSRQPERGPIQPVSVLMIEDNPEDARIILEILVDAKTVGGDRSFTYTELAWYDGREGGLACIACKGKFYAMGYLKGGNSMWACPILFFIIWILCVDIQKKEYHIPIDIVNNFAVSEIRKGIDFTSHPLDS